MQQKLLKRSCLGAILITLTFTLCRAQGVLVFHTIQTDSSGNLRAWYSPNSGIAYDHVLASIWNFWNNIPTSQGDKFYMMDHSYNNPLAGNMVGGDQFAMALSSWSLYYAYTGDSALITNMRYIADTYLAHSLSQSFDGWPYLPYPSNFTLPTVAYYDGDFLLGAGFTQPDKAASFAHELISLYKITGKTAYLTAAINIGNTLAAKVIPGDSATSPFPFKVNAEDGSLPVVLPGANYTANLVPALNLFTELKTFNAANANAYDSAYNTIKHWVQTYPQHTNNWGCFFEDIFGPSNTETNAVTMAWYILQHPEWSNTYQQDARSILDWTLSTLGSHAYDTIGVSAIYEQTSDLKEGGSHTSRFASVELLYAAVTGDTTRVAQAQRQLDWATYLCDSNGICRFSPREGSVWYTDGYGDYVRHFLRAMYYNPQLAPDNANHLLGTTSVITSINYHPQHIQYYTYDSSATETLRLTSKPTGVKANGIALNELSTLNAEGFTWQNYTTGGVLKVRHNLSRQIDLDWNPNGIAELTGAAIDVNVFPNPAKENIHAAISSSREAAFKWQIIDETGQTVAKGTDKLLQGANQFNYPGTALADGIYFLQWQVAGSNGVNKIIVNKH